MHTAPATIPRFCHRPSIDRQPSGGILSGISPVVSSLLAVPFRAKCALSECLKLSVQSTNLRQALSVDQGRSNFISAMPPGAGETHRSFEANELRSLALRANLQRTKHSGDRVPRK